MWCRTIFLLSAWHRQRMWQWATDFHALLFPAGILDQTLPVLEDHDGHGRSAGNCTFLPARIYKGGMCGAYKIIVGGLDEEAIKGQSVTVYYLWLWLCGLSYWHLSLRLSGNFLRSASIFPHTPTQEAFVTVLHVKMCQRLGQSLIFTFEAD